MLNRAKDRLKGLDDSQKCHLTNLSWCVGGLGIGILAGLIHNRIDSQIVDTYRYTKETVDGINKDFVAFTRKDGLVRFEAVTE